MAEELSPESRLYIKEEIEKVKNHFKEEVEKVKSYVTKTLTTVVIVVGLLTGLGVYGLATKYIDTTIQKWAEEKGNAKMEKKVKEAKDLYSIIETQEKKSKKIVAAMEKNLNQLPNKNGYALVGDIKFVWGTMKSTKDGGEKFLFKPVGKSDEFNFKNECFTVITSLAGDSGSKQCVKTGFTFDRVDGYSGQMSFTFVAIGR